MEFSFLYPFWWLHYWIAEIWSDYSSHTAQIYENFHKHLPLRFYRKGRDYRIGINFYPPHHFRLNDFFNPFSEVWDNSLWVTLCNLSDSEQSPGILGLKKNLWQKGSAKSYFLVPKHIHIKGNKITPNECQQKVWKWGKKNPHLYSTLGYCSLPIPLPLNKTATRPTKETAVKYTTGLKRPYLLHL